MSDSNTVRSPTQFPNFIKSINCGTCGHPDYIHHSALSSSCKGANEDGTHCKCEGFNPRQTEQSKPKINKENPVIINTNQLSDVNANLSKCGGCGHPDIYHHMAFSGGCKMSNNDGTPCRCKGFQPNQKTEDNQTLTFSEKYKFSRRW